MRAPWKDPENAFSWTTLWMNIVSLVVVLRLLVGAGMSVGDVSWNPGEIDAALTAAVMAGFGGLYYGRRAQDAEKKKPVLRKGVDADGDGKPDRKDGADG
jgi:hypothetical protein